MIRSFSIALVSMMILSPVHAQEQRAPSVLRAQADATLSSTITGRIVALPFEEGALFEEGDVLAKLDCRMQDADAAVARAEAQAQRATFASTQALFERGGTGRSNVEIAGAKLSAAEAQLQKVQLEIDGCTIAAPFKGRISEFFVNEFEHVEPAQRLFTLVSAEIPKLEIIAPADWLSWLEVGSEGEVALEATGKRLPIEVVALPPVVDPVSGTIKLGARFLGAVGDVLPGMSGVVSFASAK